MIHLYIIYIKIYMIKVCHHLQYKILYSAVQCHYYEIFLQSQLLFAK